MPDARYDRHADWYAEYIAGPAEAHTARVTESIRRILGPGHGQCLDLGCGTGVHSETIRELGWQPFGIDLSLAQLRHAVRHIPVVLADAHRLPLVDGGMEVVTATLLHTDVDNWHAVVNEVARVLQHDGRFIYVGVHPCFVGPFAVRSESQLRLEHGYFSREFTSTGGGIGAGIRARVGVYHRTLADVLNPILEAGMTLQLLEESDGPGFPDLLAFSASKHR